MKWCVLLLLAALCLCASADEEFRVFTDTQGRSIMLKVVKCDLKRDKVTVEREDKQRITVKISGFCAEDQAFIKEWFLANEILSEKNLRIKADEYELNSRREKIMGVQYSQYGPSMEVEIGSKTFERIAYYIELENRNDLPLENARIEYRLYYYQEEDRVCSGKMGVPAIKPRKKINLFSDDVEIIEYKGRGGGRSGDVHGFRMRIYVTLPSGKEAMREYCDPASLSEARFPWEVEDD